MKVRSAARTMTGSADWSKSTVKNSGSNSAATADKGRSFGAKATESDVFV